MQITIDHNYASRNSHDETRQNNLYYRSISIITDYYRNDSLPLYVSRYILPKARTITFCNPSSKNVVVPFGRLESQPWQGWQSLPTTLRTHLNTTWHDSCKPSWMHSGSNRRNYQGLGRARVAHLEVNGVGPNAPRLGLITFQNIGPCWPFSCWCQEKSPEVKKKKTPQKCGTSN
jgi:hypothetical protein